MILLCWTVLDLCHQLLPLGSSVTCDLSKQFSSLTKASSHDYSDKVVHTICLQWHVAVLAALQCHVVGFILKWLLNFLQCPSSLSSCLQRFDVQSILVFGQGSLDRSLFLGEEGREEKTTVDSGFVSVNTTVLQNKKWSKQIRYITLKCAMVIEFLFFFFLNMIWLKIPFDQIWRHSGKGFWRMPFCSSFQWNSSKHTKWKGCWYNFFGSCVLYFLHIQAVSLKLVFCLLLFSLNLNLKQQQKTVCVCFKFSSVAPKKTLCQDFQWAFYVWTAVAVSWGREVLLQNCTEAFFGLSNCGNWSQFDCAKLHSPSTNCRISFQA